MKTITIGLLGNPNCGKSTLFNVLTGARQKVGNWPGVTVERKSGYVDYQGSAIPAETLRDGGYQGENRDSSPDCKQKPLVFAPHINKEAITAASAGIADQDWRIEIVDLPGIYSLSVPADKTAIDERITCETILSGELDLIINIVNATNLERHLYLTTQLLEMRVPVILAVNMIDVARKQRLDIDIAQLAKDLQCPVIPISATQKTGMNELKNAVINACIIKKIPQATVHYPPAILNAVTQIAQQISQHCPEKTAIASCLAARLLEGDYIAEHDLTNTLQQTIKNQQNLIEQALQEEADIIIADARYSRVHEITQQTVKHLSASRKTLTQFIDRIVLHRIMGIPIFLAIMYLMFLFAINVGGAFQPFFDIGSNAIFVQGLAQVLQSLHVPIWLTAIIAAGFGKGINTTITFIPVIGAMFLFLALLESSGYMARAAFVMDRFMRAVGLPGKSFVPMIVGFGCNVPAIMATRTLDNKRDRILTIMMSPFMSCGARLAIYAVFTAAFFPRGGQNVVFALYIIGILMAIITGLILRKTVLQGNPSPLIMELPPYHIPMFRAVLLQTWQRLKRFLFKAGKLIVPICMLIGALNAVNINGTLNIGDDAQASQNSILSTIGRAVTPVFAPMGIHDNNWPATVGLVSGVLAKEVVVGTLNTLYTQDANLATADNNNFHFWQAISAALISIPQNLMALKDSLGNPVLASAPDHDVNQGVLGVMYQRFDGQIGAMAYLLFVLLYFPCVSATAAMLRELNRRWTVFSVVWTTGLAYAIAVVFYQAATFIRHPLSSVLWIILFVGLFLAVLFYMRRYAGNYLSATESISPKKISLAAKQSIN